MDGFAFQPDTAVNDPLRRFGDQFWCAANERFALAGVVI